MKRAAATRDAAEVAAVGGRGVGGSGGGGRGGGGGGGGAGRGGGVGGGVGSGGRGVCKLFPVNYSGSRTVCWSRLSVSGASVDRVCWWGAVACASCFV